MKSETPPAATQPQWLFVDVFAEERSDRAQES